MKTGPRVGRPCSMLWASLLCALSLAACKRQIGDACKSSIDCSQEVERLCDISQPGGYCTVEGCDERTCPGDSVCVRFFPRIGLTKTCTAGGTPDGGTPAGGTLDGCSPDEQCLPDGYCVPRATERRFCVASCTDNSDCRSGYECRKAGISGSLPLVSNPGADVHFCAPAGR